MTDQDLIPTQTICSLYSIEVPFVDTLNNMGLIRILKIENNQFIHQDQINDLEKIIRLYNDLNVNLEGIDIVFNLLNKERKLKRELITLKNRLRLYENE